MARSTGGDGHLVALFVTGVIAGTSWCAAAWLEWQGPGIAAWKGTGVGLLAIWAAARARSADGWAIAAVLACGAIGDVLIDVVGLTAGAVAFLVGHAVAIWLYARHRRLSAQVIPACGVAVSVAAFAIARDPGVALYALGLGAMAGAASASRFPAQVAIGAWLFVLSDLLIFARMGPLADSPLPTLLVWPTYFAGQALIAHAVVSNLSDRPRRQKRP